MSNEELNAMQRGFHRKDELEDLNVFPSRDKLMEKRVALIECVEEIPCNPCGVVCRVNAIDKEDLCTLGKIDWDKCTGCTMCVAVCPGLSIFLQSMKNGKGYVTMPYELLPAPKVGMRVRLRDRSGKFVGEGRIVNPTYQARGDAYPRWVVTVEMDDPELSYEVRAIQVMEE